MPGSRNLEAIQQDVKELLLLLQDYVSQPVFTGKKICFLLSLLVVHHDQKKAWAAVFSELRFTITSTRYWILAHPYNWIWCAAPRWFLCVPSLGLIGLIPLWRNLFLDLELHQCTYVWTRDTSFLRLLYLFVFVCTNFTTFFCTCLILCIAFIFLFLFHPTLSLF